MGDHGEERADELRQQWHTLTTLGDEVPGSGLAIPVHSCAPPRGDFVGSYEDHFSAGVGSQGWPFVAAMYSEVPRDLRREREPLIE
ncbi:hypothetical protein [Streptomyces sp. NPDC055400]